ncbi:MAG: SH3 domain-containing C40 family peptidase [Bacillota bacterium]
MNSLLKKAIGIVLVISLLMTIFSGIVASAASGKVTGSNVNFRVKPSLTSKVIKKLSKGTKANVISKKGKWFKVKIGGKIGYINSDFFKTSGSTTGRGTGSQSQGEDVIDFAKTLLGIRYVYGSESPSGGFDCSGLVYYVYRHFGYSMNRTAHEFVSNGVKVSKSDLQAGDIILFRKGGRIFHAALYIGGDKIIQAEPHQGVNIDKLFGDSYYSKYYDQAIRVIK